jgi:hypothetical protein
LDRDIPSFGVVLKSVNRELDLGGPSCCLCFAFDLGCERRKVVGASTLGRARYSDTLTGFALIADVGYTVPRTEYDQYSHCMVLDLGIHCSGEAVVS